MSDTAPALEPSRARWTTSAALEKWAPFLKLVFVALELAFLVKLMERFRLEHEAFRSILPFVLGGFVVHHLLPLRARLPFFLALSLATTAYVVGLRAGGQWDLSTSISRSATLFGVGLCLIGLCHVPVAFGARIAMLLGAGAALAACRADWIAVPALGPIWPILGAMFMFRLMVYAYDVAHQKEPQRLSRSLAYFFLLPNVCFPLFPVIDFKTFCRSHYGTDAFAIYQKGVGWILRGIVHLLLWRIVYYELYLDPRRVESGADLGRFIITNMLLYLRVSGQFHLVIGLLHLFGFDLPATNRHYFLASSFTDYWRRVNIYWKDFIMKVFYYPIAFRLKGWKQEKTVIVASCVAFLVSWVLHPYQQFWLQGVFPLKWTDTLFWGTLAVLVVLSSLRELKRGRSRVRAQGKRGWRLARLALSTAGTFLALSLLWSIWSSDDIEQWASLWSRFDGWTAAWLAAAAGVVMIAAVAMAELPGDKRLGSLQGAAAPPFSLARSLRDCLVPAALVFGVTSSVVTSRLPEEYQVIARSLSQTTPNKSDEEYLVRGYYEGIMDSSRSSSVLRESFLSQPADWVRLEETAAVRPTDDLRLRELVPSSETLVNGVPVRVNRWGFRDQDYELEKSPGTYRIAMLGSSLAMGWGVEHGEPFESLIEERMNRELKLAGKSKYEILNFGVNGYSPIQNLATLESRALQFKPDALLIITHKEDPLFTMEAVARALRRGIAMPPELAAIARKAGIDARTPDSWVQRELARYWPEVFTWAYARIADICRAEKIEPIWVFLPGVLEKGRPDKKVDAIFAAAESAGFPRVVLDPVRLYGDFDDRKALTIAPWDAHPNKRGHELIAAGLYEGLLALPPFSGR